MTSSTVSATPASGVPPELPHVIELDADAKRQVMAALRLVITRLQEAGHFRGDADYQAVIGSPALLFDFIQAFRSHIGAVADIVVDGAGRPVVDPAVPLACGPSLAQICQMLVYTCAKRQFSAADSGKPPPAKAPPGKLASLLGRKPPPPPPPSEDETKLAALKDVLAFDWQLPLLKSYYFFLDRAHIEALGRDLLYLRSNADVEMAGALPVSQIVQARRLAGPGFGDLLLRWPAALRGVASVLPESYRFFRPLLGPRVWEFFSRDPAEIAELSEGDRDLLAAFGPFLADASLAAVQAFDRMPLDRVRIFLAAFQATFKDNAGALLADSAFCRQTLKSIVRSFATFDGKAEDFRGLVELKCAAIAPAVQAYLAKRRLAEAPA